MTFTDGMRVDAPAKLNLTLHILGKRVDGYHEMESLVVFAAVGDVVEVAAADSLTLAMDGEFAAAAGGVEGNLVLRAARLLQQKTDCTKGAAIRLTKNIPVGAGLGGGSADAAATLRALTHLWGLNISQAQLEAWAPELGADVAMCIASRPVVACGIGEQLAPLTHPLPEMHAVLVHPRTPLLTMDVYGALVVTPAAPALGDADAARSAAEWMYYLTQARNDLETAALHVSPEVGQVRAALGAALPSSPLVRMSGSGACCYALYASAVDAERAAMALRTQHPQWWVVATELCR